MTELFKFFKPSYNFKKLAEITHVVTNNLNNVIDIRDIVTLRLIFIFTARYGRDIYRLFIFLIINFYNESSIFVNGYISDLSWTN